MQEKDEGGCEVDVSEGVPTNNCDCGPSHASSVSFAASAACDSPEMTW